MVERVDNHDEHARIATPRTRDFALRRLAVCNRWLMAGSLALTGVFSELAASAFPGKSARAAGTHRAPAGTPAKGSPAKAHVTHDPPSSLQAPAQAPQASPETHTSATPEGQTATPEAHASAPEVHSEATPEHHESTPEAHTEAAPEQHVEQAAPPATESSQAAPAQSTPEASQSAPQQSAPAQSAPETPVVSGGS
jgi:hypothetical protein